MRRVLQTQAVALLLVAAWACAFAPVGQTLSTPPEMDPPYQALALTPHEFIQVAERIWWTADRGARTEAPADRCRIVYRQGHLWLVEPNQTERRIMTIRGADLPDGLQLFPPTPALIHRVDASPAFPSATRIYWTTVGGEFRPFRRTAFGSDRRRHAIEHPSGAWITVDTLAEREGRWGNRVRWFDDDVMVADRFLPRAAFGVLNRIWPTVDGVRLFSYGTMDLQEQSGHVDLEAGTLARLRMPGRFANLIRRKPVRAAIGWGIIVLCLAQVTRRHWSRWPLGIVSTVFLWQIGLALAALLLNQSLM